MCRVSMRVLVGLFICEFLLCECLIGVFICECLLDVLKSDKNGDNDFPVAVCCAV